MKKIKKTGIDNYTSDWLKDALAEDLFGRTWPRNTEKANMTVFRDAMIEVGIRKYTNT